MSVYEVNPLRDPRWPELLQRDSRASVFHTPGWLETLRRSYGYDPVVLTTSPPRHELTNGIVFCRVNSWLTGRRMVSLPFSDHCDPLLDGSEDLAEIVSFLRGEVRARRLNFVEIRPLNSLTGSQPRLSEFRKFYFHKLDLQRDADEICQSFHKNCIRRKIQRAKREDLTYEKGKTRPLLEQFYRLFVMTRRRHGLPPSPFRWLSNLNDCLGDKVQVRIASKNGQPVAAMITLTHKNSMVYKYGASNRRFSNLGGVPFLFWKAILEAKSQGLTELDFGRCDPENQGLIRFKNRWGTVMSTLTYWRLPMDLAPPPTNNWTSHIARGMLAHAPNPLLVQVGNLFYRHVG